MHDRGKVVPIAEHARKNVRVSSMGTFQGLTGRRMGAQTLAGNGREDFSAGHLNRASRHFLFSDGVDLKLPNPLNP